MTNDKIKGKGKEIAGSVRAKVGEATGNEDMEAEGRAQQIEGKAQGVLGKAKDKLGDAKDAARKVKDKVS